MRAGWGVVVTLILFSFSCSSSLLDGTTAPHLQYVGGPNSVLNHTTPGAQDIKYGIEGGTVVKSKEDGRYHLFTAEMQGDPFWVKMRIGYWVSSGPNQRDSFVRVRTLFESSGNFNGSDPRAALWGPMPYFYESEQYWYLVYVAYRAAPNNASGWYGNYDGKIWLAKSIQRGYRGIGGPYKDIGIILQPDKNSQSWEGLQGTDSFFIYNLPPSSGNHLMAFYGSANTQNSWPWYNGRWLVGLAKASSPLGPWTRLPSNPVEINHNFTENPVVSMEENIYLMIYDDIQQQNIGFGFTYSLDGINWAPGTLVRIPFGVRTPLALIKEATGLYTLFYTNTVENYECLYYANIKLSFTSHD